MKQSLLSETALLLSMLVLFGAGCDGGNESEGSSGSGPGGGGGMANTTAGSGGTTGSGGSAGIGGTTSDGGVPPGGAAGGPTGGGTVGGEAGAGQAGGSEVGGVGVAGMEAGGIATSGSSSGGAGGAGTGGQGGKSAVCGTGHLPEVLGFFKSLQARYQSGLVPHGPYGNDSGTYMNGLAAMVFTLCGDYAAAASIFERFPAGGDPMDASLPDCSTLSEGQGGGGGVSGAGGGAGWSACVCRGGYMQQRNAESGDASGNFWIGDNAWLLASLEQYAHKSPDGEQQRYTELIQQLRKWFVCLGDQTRALGEQGIHAGYYSDGQIQDPNRQDGQLELEMNPEGNIDVYGALGFAGADADAAELRASIKSWLSTNVWPSDGQGCFDKGPKTTGNLATDNVSYAVLALGPDADGYQCLLRHAEATNARRWSTSDRYWIDVFDRPYQDYWMKDDRAGAVTVEPETHALQRQLYVAFDWKGDGGNWLRLYRDAYVDLTISDGFVYSFSVESSLSGPRLEVKFRGKDQTGSDQEYCFFHVLDGDDVAGKSYAIPRGELRPWSNCEGPPAESPPVRISQLEFALNANGNTSPGSIRIGPVWYSDSGTAPLEPVEGFSAFASDTNWIWVEGTAQMATAYCYAAGSSDARYQRYHDQLGDLVLASSNPSVEGRGIPYYLTGAMNNWEPSALASAWLAFAEACQNPFEVF